MNGTDYLCIPPTQPCIVSLHPTHSQQRSETKLGMRCRASWPQGREWCAELIIDLYINYWQKENAPSNHPHCSWWSSKTILANIARHNFQTILNRITRITTNHRFRCKMRCQSLHTSLTTTFSACLNFKRVVIVLLNLLSTNQTWRLVLHVDLDNHSHTPKASCKDTKVL